MTPKWVINLVDALKSLRGVPAVYVNALIAVAVAVLLFLQTAYGSDEAAKYVEPKELWRMRIHIGAWAAGLFALRLYLSTGYADHLQSKKDKENTDTWRKQAVQQEVAQQQKPKE